MSNADAMRPSSPRRRMSREHRRRQLLDTAWRLVNTEGTESLTLGRLAEAAGVTKPVVYDHFARRPLLLTALYRDFDERQTASMDAALRTSADTLQAKATVIASSYVDCVIRQGREIPDVVAALAGSPELEETRRNYQLAFLAKCRTLLTPFADTDIAPAGLWAMLGAADALSHAATTGDLTADEAKTELTAIIEALARRR